MTNKEILDRLQNILANELSEPVQGGEISVSAPVVNAGIGLDSISLLEFVISIENEFEITLDTGSLAVENFDSLNALAGLIQSKLADKVST